VYSYHFVTGDSANSNRSRYGTKQGDLMNFEENLFISYAHIDDEPLTPGEKGWITRFHATLKAILSTRMGREAKIWPAALSAGAMSSL
jgi:hypothetical protein